MNVDFTVRLRGESAHVLKKIVDSGYSASKTEAVRAALIHYGLELGLISANELFKKTAKRVSARGYSEEDIKAQLSAIRSR